MKQAIAEVINEVENQYPYKKPGDRYSYSQYKEGWSDACQEIRDQLKALDNSSPEVSREQEFKKWFTYFVMHHGDYPSEEATWDWIKTNLLNQIK